MDYFLFLIQKLGQFHAPPGYTPFEISYQLNDAEAETIICQDTNYGYVTEVLNKTPLKRVIVTNLVDLLPKWKKAVGWFFDRVPRGFVDKKKEVYQFTDLLKNNPANPPQVEMVREQLAHILYTGERLFPKVPSTQSGLVFNMGLL